MAAGSVDVPEGDKLWCLEHGRHARSFGRAHQGLQSDACIARSLKRRRCPDSGQPRELQGDCHSDMASCRCAGGKHRSGCTSLRPKLWSEQPRCTNPGQPVGATSCVETYLVGVMSLV